MVSCVYMYGFSCVYDVFWHFITHIYLPLIVVFYVLIFDLRTTTWGDFGRGYKSKRYSIEQMVDNGIR